MSTPTITELWNAVNAVIDASGRGVTAVAGWRGATDLSQLKDLRVETVPTEISSEPETKDTAELRRGISVIVSRRVDDSRDRAAVTEVVQLAEDLGLLLLNSDLSVDADPLELRTEYVIDPDYLASDRVAQSAVTVVYTMHGATA